MTVLPRTPDTPHQVEDLPEAREFQLERLLSIMTSLVAVTGQDTRAANATGDTELFMQASGSLRSLGECRAGARANKNPGFSTGGGRVSLRAPGGGRGACLVGRDTREESS